MQWRLEQISSNHVRLTGQVEIETKSKTKFFADEIDIFTDPNLRLVATGNVVFSTPEGRIAAERVEFNVAEGAGTFHLATGTMSMGPTADRVPFGNQDPDVYFYGDTIEKVSDRRYRITRGGFTTCVQPTPRWEVVGDSVVININDYAIARNMLLRVKGVPLMYLPVIYYPIKGDERATGFLLPTYGTSTIRGQTLSNAFFWAMGKSQDATFFHDWFTRAGQGIGSEYRYVAGHDSYGNFKFYRFGQSQAEFTQARSSTVTVLPAQTTFQLNVAGTQALGRSLVLRQNVDYSSSIVTKQLYQQNIYQASNATRSIGTAIDGTWGGFTASGAFQRSETFANTVDSQVYGNTPRLAASVAPTRLFGLPFYASTNSEYAFLPYRSRRAGRTVSDRSMGRFDVRPTLRAPLFRLPFLNVNSILSYRSTYYTRSAGSPDPLLRRYYSERMEVIGPVFARIWDTPNSSFRERMKHVIEPAFAFEYVSPIANSRRVPILTDTSDAVTGGAGTFTYGLNNRVFFKKRTADASPGETVPILAVGVQQTYYFSKLASQTDTRYVSTTTKPVDLSPIALTVRSAPSLYLESTARVDYGVHGEGLRVVSIGAAKTETPVSVGQLVPDGLRSASVSYSRSRASRTAKPVSSLGGGLGLSFLQGRVSGNYSLSWDISRAKVLSQGVRAGYIAQCCGILGEFQKYQYPQTGPNFPIPSDRRFNISFVLAGLGTFSNFFGAFGSMMGFGL
jgi:LPS-assembly protein